MAGKKNFIVVWLVIFALGAFYSAEAQQTKKLHRVGYLTANTSDAELPRLEAFRQALRELGHVEGQNIAIEYRHAEGKFDRLPGLAAELVGLKLDVLSGLRRTLFKLPSRLRERSPSSLSGCLIR